MATDQWKKPPIGWKKLNFVSLTGEKFVGGVLRDHTGNTVFAYGSPVKADCIYDLPAVALLHGIDKVISQKGCDHRVIFEGNAQTFIKEFNQGRDVVKPSLAAEIREKLNSLVEYRVEFAPYDTHYAALLMADQAKDEKNCVYYDNENNFPIVFANLCRIEATRSFRDSF